ncbi:unnamed protein product [Prorocentrum cordatum]|uniref:Photosystem I reaction center subunit III n=2 Tax=Prorocentrum cordatum TaxID=2364126 RepID=A0ABN9WU49_9DINO|nr:unnamed protein product [Polarella glacialis]
MARALPAAVAACAVGAALFATAAFVLPTASGPLAAETRLPRARGQLPEAPGPASPEAAPLPAWEQQEPSPLKWIGAGLLAGMVFAALTPPAEALDRDSNAVRPTLDKFTIKAAKYLELCKDNKKYAKKWKDKFFKVDSKLKKYPKDTAVYNRLLKKKAGLQRRKEAYGERLCGKKDGVPRTIATGEFVRGGIIPSSLAFIYTTGWIGWAGRSYLRRTLDTKKEIMIDVPLALTCMASGFAWPVYAWQEIVNGEMVAKDEDIHRSFF